MSEGLLQRTLEKLRSNALLRWLYGHRDYLKVGAVRRAIRSNHIHDQYYSKSRARFSESFSIRSNASGAQLFNATCMKSFGFFLHSKVLDRGLVSPLLSNLDGENSVYDLSGVQSKSQDDPRFNGKLPDYKVVSLAGNSPGAGQLLDRVYEPLIYPIERSIECSLRPTSIWIYRTYGRNLNELLRDGNYGSFEWHFDNSGIPRTYKLMIYLSDVLNRASGPFEICRATQEVTSVALPGVGNARVPEIVANRFEQFTFFGSAGDALAFNVHCIHRGGQTVDGCREVAVIELVPSLLSYHVFNSKYPLKGNDHYDGSSYSEFKDNPFLASE